MRKIILIILIAFIFLVPINVNADDLEVSSNNVILYNLNDKEILYEKNAKEKVEIASLTKIMTVLVSVENIKDYDEKIVFPKINTKKLWDYSKVGFKDGSIYTYNDLLYGSILSSGADATEGLALLIGKSEEKFANMMNEKANKIGLKNTNFANSYGEDTNNYSTAEDVLMLLNYALNNKKFYEIFTTKSYKLSNDKIIYSTLNYYSKNINDDLTNIIGSKTGYTSKAGLCMASMITKEKMKYLLITLGAPSDTDEPLQILDTINISNYFYDNYEYIRLIDKDEFITKIKLFWFFNKNIYSEEMVEKYLPKDKETSFKYESINNINSKSKIGDVIGKYDIYYGDKIVKTIDIKIENTGEYKFWIFINKYIYLILGTIILLIFGLVLLTKKNRIPKLFDNRVKTH